MREKAFAVAAGTVFDGERSLADHAVLVAGDTIADVMPRSKLPRGVAAQLLGEGEWLVPGFIDIQVNGGGDVLLNDAPTADTIRTIVAAHRRFGTTSLLPTLISDTDDKMRAALAAVADAMRSEPAVLGIHFEGPFLSPERAGVHARDLLRAPEPHHLDLITGLKTGVTLMTLAPELVPPDFLAALRARNVRIAFGHSMATYDQTRAAIGAGVTGFTHLFNAMRPLGAREPGPIAAALESPGAYYGLIVDGEHVHPSMLRLALRGAGTAMLVTDAMPPVGGTQKTFVLHGEKIHSDGGKLVTAGGTLAGAALDMTTALRNCVEILGLNLASALPLATIGPAKFLGLENRLGRLARGYRADMVGLSTVPLRTIATWVAGNAQ
jgi:N-acetylglucosamine-6-phosphate deacetylase